MDAASLCRIADELLGQPLTPAEAESVSAAVAHLPQQYRALMTVALPSLAECTGTPQDGHRWLQMQGKK